MCKKRKSAKNSENEVEWQHKTKSFARLEKFAWRKTTFNPSCRSFLHPMVASRLQRLTFSDILQRMRAITGDILIVSQVKKMNHRWIPEVDAYKGDLWINLLKIENSLLQLWICSPNKIFKYNTRVQTVKAYRYFDSRLHLGGLNVPKGPNWLDHLAKLS